jgi:thiol:disulfide interchange protein DsbG
MNGSRPTRARSIAAVAALSVAVTLAGLLDATAQTATAESAIPLPAPVAATVAKLTGGKAKVLQAFKAPAGLIGVAFTEGPGQNGIIYVAPDGAYVFSGNIVAADGSDVTKAEADQFLPKPPTAADNFAVLDKTHTYLWGQAGAKKEVWIVFDPNCIYCHKTFDSMKQYVADGTLKVHIIQVGFLKPSSLGKAAAILAAKDPIAALTTDEEKFDVAAEEGGIAQDMSDAKAVQTVRDNNAWMETQGIGGTPYLLYRDTEGKPQAADGYVEDVASLLAQIGASKE